MLEKLIELIGSTRYGENDRSTIGGNFQRGFIEKIAAHLIANGVTIQRWIPVTERLPEESGDYLTITTYGKCIKMPYSAVHQAFNMFDDGIGHQIHCSYWMPLPQAPGKEADGNA